MAYPVQTPPPALPAVGQGQVVAPPALPQVGDAGVVRHQLRDLADRLKGATRLREDLVREIRNANPDQLPILRQQLSVTDAQIASLQGQFSQLIGQLAQDQVQHWLPQIGVDPAGMRGPSFSPDVFRVGMLLVVLAVIVPLSIWVTRLIRRRRPQPVRPQDGEVLSTARLDRLEQAVDAIAIEIERISEGQRFMTRLLAEGSGPALPVGQKPAESVRVSDREPVRASRE
jgi:hypothetical protein